MWYRARFLSNADDYRPVKFPPPGPYWCSGQTENDFVIVAYVKRKTDIEKFWPEAEDIEFTRETDIVFTDRFPKPDWWESAK